MVKLYSHSTQMSQKLVRVGLLGEDTEGALQPLELTGQLDVLLGQQRDD